MRSGRTLFQLISAKIDQNKSFRSVNGSTCNKKSSSGFLPFCSPKIPQHSGSTSPAGNWICGLLRRNNSVNLSSESLAESDTKSYSKGYFRYLLLLISILCMTSTRSNELSFNFTVICMTSNSSVNNVCFTFSLAALEIYIFKNFHFIGNFYIPKRANVFHKI